MKTSPHNDTTWRTASKSFDFLMALPVLVAFAYSTAEAFGSSASLTVLAPGQITDLTRAEARVSIQNPAAQDQNYELELYLDSNLGTQTLATTNINVPAGGQQLHSSWFPTAGLGGQNTIRYKVTPNGGAPLSGKGTLQVVASDTRSVPLITAAWIDPGAVLSGIYPQQRPITAQDVRDSVDAAHNVGVNTLIISYSEYILNNWGAFYPSQTMNSVASFDVVGTVLDQASKNGQRVFVGLGRGDDLLLTWNGFDDPERNAAALAHGTTVANELWDLYSDESSFYGWYLSHEANEIGPASQSYYNPMVEILRGFGADKPVMISPSGTPIISPQILSDSEVDVFTYQDAVGSGYIPYVNTFDPQQRIDMLDNVFASYETAHGPTNKHLWANLENWQMDGPAYANAYPADFSRLMQQLEIEKNYVDLISSYEWLGFMEHPDSTAVLGGQRAVDLYVNYRDYYEQVLPTLKTHNYVGNPGFESGMQGDGTPAEWSFTGGAGQAVSLSSDAPGGSISSLSLDIDQATGLPLLIQDVAISEGEEYKFSAWVKELVADPSDGWLAAQVWMLPDASSGSILDSVTLFYDEADWEFQSAFITAPAGAGVARIVFAIQDSTFNVGTGHYLIDGVSLVGAAPIPGDYDGNGMVDAADYDVWKSTFGSRIDLRADGNKNGVVDSADYSIWIGSLSFSDGSAVVSEGAVPEPSTIGLLSLVCLGLACWTQRCRS